MNPDQNSTPIPTADPAPDAGATGRPPLIDVRIEKPGSAWPIWLILIASASIGAAGGVMRAATGIQSGPLLTICFLAVVMMIASRAANKNTEKRVRRIVSSDLEGDLAALAREATKPPVRSFKPHPAQALARELARLGRVEKTIRMQYRDVFQTLEPLRVAFEPRLLDQADPAFEELQSAVSTNADHTGAQSPLPSSRDDILGVRRIKRNVATKSGRIAVIAMIIGFLFMAVGAVFRRTISWELPFFGLFLFAMLYAPAQGSWFGTKHWFLASGGLIVRQARWRDRTSTLHLFHRRNSVLCACQFRKSLWIIAVADAEACEQTAATDAEVSLLLRAWLSPLEPPPVERLSDLR